MFIILLSKKKYDSIHSELLGTKEELYKAQGELINANMKLEVYREEYKKLAKESKTT